MHERPEFDAADLTAMMTRVARLRAQAEDLSAVCLARDAPRQAHLCRLLSASLEQSLDHLSHMCAPHGEEVPAGYEHTGPFGQAYAEAYTLLPPVPESLRSQRYLRPHLIDTVVGDTLLSGCRPAPRDLLLPPDEPVRGRGHDDEHAIPPARRPAAGLLGSAEWHLDTDEVRWSDEMYALFDRDPVLGPLRLDDLPSHVLPGDLPVVEGMASRLLGESRPVEGEFRILCGDGRSRAVHVVAEPVLDADGAPRSVWAIVRDVTELRWTQAALTEAREQLVVQRQLARAEHRIAAELQRVVMPRWTRAIGLPGLDVATRYFPAEATARVGGDWYDGMALPDRSVLITLGDMAGHGLAAAAGMTTLRSALEGFAVIGASPGTMLYWLNRLLLHVLPAEAIATALCARYDPERRELTWARAGHPAPLLFRAGKGRVLDPPRGIVLGVHDEPEYVEARVELRAGDVLLLFTDGLIERRGHDMDDSIAVLLGLAPLLAGADARSCVDLVVSRLGHTDYEDDACVMAIRVT
ncbi:PP2C family protein-serine/threonine phosphatase [Yinghuangia seranimata]|uniref:PP2C family protein-serine/threonine phosphatase n=1 Tax=Yinghuangia seranimata TaxID=408067 RepID=UPI00248AC8DC|nr:SpoIIE family protein phosphatase [Yinghuangia seranimata]MDI2132788.1 SpoIIE family protein phosphatase [Yinghuangia seranimata]